jgi:hypothetical protein
VSVARDSNYHAVTTLGLGVDGSVRRIEYGYDGRGSLALVTSYDAASGRNVVNQVLRQFDGLGQLAAEYQSHAGAVDTATTPAVRYGYSAMAGGADHSRLTSVTYPDGYVLNYNYSSGLNDGISRLSSLSDSTGTLESYDYLGVGTVVRRAHPQPNVDLSYVKRAGEGDGDAGDQYAGLDRFGRVVDQRWLDPTTGTATDRFQYAYCAEPNCSRTFSQILAVWIGSHEQSVSRIVVNSGVRRRTRTAPRQRSRWSCITRPTRAVISGLLPTSWTAPTGTAPATLRVVRRRSESRTRTSAAGRCC